MQKHKFIQGSKSALNTELLRVVIHWKNFKLIDESSREIVVLLWYLLFALYNFFLGGGGGVIKMKAGYFIYDNKVNNLFFMVDVKKFSKNEKEMNSLVSATQVISKDISRESGF